METIPRPLLFGHRGARGEAPENTLPGFQRALDMGMDGVEMDVQLCQTGEVVVVHDETLSRVTAGGGHIKAYTYEQLRALDVGSHFGPDVEGVEKFRGERIPRLEEVLDLVGEKMWLDLELKGRSIHSDGLEEKVIGIMVERNLIENVILSSFNPFIIMRVKMIDPRFKTGLNYLSDFAEKLRKLWFAPFVHPFSVHPQPGMVDSAYLDRARRRNARVMPWGVNEPEDIQRLLALGVDGIISDYPARLKEINRNREIKRPTPLRKT